MADDQPSAGTTSAATRKKTINDVTVGGPKVATPTQLSISEQAAERDWQFLMLVMFGLILILTGPLVVNILATALFMILVSPLQVLRYVTTDDTGFPVVSLLLIAAVYGGYSILPIWLRPPVEKTLIRSGAYMKVGNYRMIDHDGRQLTSSQYPIDITRLKSMGYTPVTILPDFFKADPVIDADGKVHCPVIVAVVKPVIPDDSTTLPLERPVTSFLTSEGPRISDDNDIHVEAGIALSHSDVAPGGIQGDLPQQDKPVAGPIDTSHVLGENIIVPTDIHTNAVVEEEAVAAEEGSDTSSDDTLGLDELFAPTSPTSKSSAGTPLSSDESEVCDENRLLPNDEEQKTEDDAPEHVTRDIVQPYRMKQQLTSDELDRMAKAHGYPSFCVGPLWIAVALQAPDVRSYYLDNENKEIFPANCLVTDPRPLSADAKDIDHMLECLGDKVPAAIQRLLPDNVDILHTTRNGATGSNIHMAELAERYFQHCHNLPNLEAVRRFEKKRTLRQRFGLLPGVKEASEYRQFFDLLPGIKMTSERLDLVPGMEESSEYRRYLSNDQEVKLGNTDYLKSVHAKDDEYELKVLKHLKTSDDHDGAKLPNLVLPWLDGIEELGLYDANAHLPCECGKAALAIHMESRQNAEPGLYRCEHDYEEPEMTFLSESALQEDQQRKKLEEEHSSAPVGFMRSQKIFQICELHAISTNKPYILTDGIEDLNDALVTTGDNLPVPGFWKCSKYPPGFTMPLGFLDLEHKDRLPRCRHGDLHPSLVGHCVICFPSGDHDGDCSECDGHAHASALTGVGTKQNDMDAAGEQWDQHQLEEVRAAADWEKEIAHHVQYAWPLPHYRPWFGW
jgi:hypothetical protein